MAIHQPLVHVVMGCPCMYSYLPYSRCTWTKPQNRKGDRIDVPNTPKSCGHTHCRLFLNFKSRLLRYSKPVYPSPLAYILLSPEFFLFGIALSFRGGFSLCLIDALALRRMNGMITRPVQLGMCALISGGRVAYNRPGLPYRSDAHRSPRCTLSADIFR